MRMMGSCAVDFFVFFEDGGGGVIEGRAQGDVEGYSMVFTAPMKRMAPVLTSSMTNMNDRST